MENKETINVKEEVQKSRRIGTLTFGALLIVFGILMILQMFINTDILRYVIKLWPVIFIFYGIETIYFATKKDVKIKYDIGAFILTFFILGSGLVLGLINYGVNQLFYNNEVRGIFFESMGNVNHKYTFDEKVTIKNLSQKEVEYSVIVDSAFDETEVNIKAEYNYDGTIKIPALANSSNWLYNNIEDSDNKIIIKEIPDIVKKVKIVVYTNNKDNVEYIK
jgi:hypothetical protein